MRQELGDGVAIDLQEDICMAQICVSSGYRDSSIMHENFSLNLKVKRREIEVKGADRIKAAISPTPTQRKRYYVPVAAVILGGGMWG